MNLMRAIVVVFGEGMNNYMPNSAGENIPSFPKDNDYSFTHFSMM